MLSFLHCVSLPPALVHVHPLQFDCCIPSWNDGHHWSTHHSCLNFFMLCLVPSNKGANVVDNSKAIGGTYPESIGSHGASLWGHHQPWKLNEECNDAESQMMKGKRCLLFVMMTCHSAWKILWWLLWQCSEDFVRVGGNRDSEKEAIIHNHFILFILIIVLQSRTNW